MPDEDQDAYQREGEGEPIIEPRRSGRTDLQVEREAFFPARFMEGGPNGPRPCLLEIDLGGQHPWMRAAFRPGPSADGTMMTVPVPVLEVIGFRRCKGQIDFRDWRPGGFVDGLKGQAQQDCPHAKWRGGGQDGDPLAAYLASGDEGSEVSERRFDPGSAYQGEPDQEECGHDLEA